MTSDWFCIVIISASRTTRRNLVPAVATSESCSARELQHWAPLIISNPFCRSVSYIFGQSHSLTLWQGITEGRVAVERGKEKPIVLLHFTSYKLPDRRALCVTVIYYTEPALKKMIFLPLLHQTQEALLSLLWSWIFNSSDVFLFKWSWKDTLQISKVWIFFDKFLKLWNNPCVQG